MAAIGTDDVAARAGRIDHGGRHGRAGGADGLVEVADDLDPVAVVAQGLTAGGVRADVVSGEDTSADERDAVAAVAGNQIPAERRPPGQLSDSVAVVRVRVRAVWDGAHP